MDDTSEVKVLASSAYNFRIELVIKVGKIDIPYYENAEDTQFL